ncbi:RNA polymerase sigma factor [Dyadobacter sp. CY323]|uniref:RNA polymerase sigma factor n=1 Tax=Dyadobacter sp. CY323 TaxID=2907302 RepID=UPI001F3A9A10|nr:sigma-70 family RNA polymerase sigma factor [Dyadobacter sp. CY323]MCE6989862.1 sigma-70 family RNA polymerase sigma factor [Dyadobacter sp. CY323]
MKPYTSDDDDSVSDQDLWSAFKGGDRTAFAHIYQRHFRKLIAYGIKVAGDKDVVKDCIQDLYVELWETKGNLANVSSIQFYLLKALRYKIIRHLEDSGEDTLDTIHWKVQEDNFELQMLQEESSILNYKKLDTAINLLPKRQREAVQLRYFHDMSNEQVAQVMGVNYQSACKFIYTALKSLRQIMHLSSFSPLLIAFFGKL